MSTARALISIGTNSTRLLIVRGNDVLAAQSIGTRLGAGLDATGALDPDAQARTLAAIDGYMAIVRGHGAAVDAIATSALRRAADAPAFIARVAACAGVAPRVLSGDDEATYSFLGAVAASREPGPIGVLDVGGGSTEYALGTTDAVERTCSLEIGAVRLSERHAALLGARPLTVRERAEAAHAARADASAVLAPLAGFPRPGTLIAVGGTVFTAAAMVAGDPSRDGVELDAASRAELIDALLARDLTARRALPCIRPQRADILPAGLIVVDEACRLLGIERLRVSHADLLSGYLASPAYRADGKAARSAIKTSPPG